MHREATGHWSREKAVTRRSPFSLLVFSDNHTQPHIAKASDEMELREGQRKTLVS